ncbi:Alpha/Beta hydrolase protein [Cyathus striatus]|nr:Alpha/Beta hydrolase protein [Cyathus striatus]
MPILPSDEDPSTGSTFTIQRFTFDSPQKISGAPFKIAANQYTHTCCHEEGLTLLFAHSNGAHKEQWEPVLEELFSIQSNQGDLNRNSVREAWALDAPAYGDSALLNEISHAERMNNMSTAEFGIAVASVAESHHFKGHRLVLVGFSLGTTACMYATKIFMPVQPPYAGIILIEPVFLDRYAFYNNIKDREHQLGFMTRTVALQRNSWESRDQAYEWLSKRKPWSQWDTRVLKIYAEFGLKEIISNGKIKTFQTKCSKEQEATIFSDVEPPFVAADQVATVCSKGVPVHDMFGSINDLVPRYSQDSITDVTKGRNVATLTRIPGERHMIAQENPRVVAEYIDGILKHNIMSAKL